MKTMKFKINKRKSWFWHWFAMTAWDYPDFVYCAMNFRYDNPFTPVERPCAQYSNHWESAMFYKDRVLKNRHCEVYHH